MYSRASSHLSASRPGSPAGSSSHGDSLPEKEGTVLESGQKEERFRIDRKKLEDMTQTPHGTENADAFFQRVRLQTSTQISCSSKLETDPHVKVVGTPEAVQMAKEMILELLDIKEKSPKSSEEVTKTTPKPNILVHIIDGLIIQEGFQPFPVSTVPGPATSKWCPNFENEEGVKEDLSQEVEVQKEAVPVEANSPTTSGIASPRGTQLLAVTPTVKRRREASPGGNGFKKRIQMVSENSQHEPPSTSQQFYVKEAVITSAVDVEYKKSDSLDANPEYTKQFSDDKLSAISSFSDCQLILDGVKEKVLSKEVFESE